MITWPLSNSHNVDVNDATGTTERASANKSAELQVKPRASNPFKRVLRACACHTACKSLVLKQAGRRESGG
jgi:hypothetical protein